MLEITIGDKKFKATLEEASAPKTVAAIRKMLPFKSKLIQARWSGQAAWVPMGDFEVGVGYENQTSHPFPGEILIYTGDLSETEILVPYGRCTFAADMGQLAGNHFATLQATREDLREIGETVLWKGAQDFTMEETD